jgi:diaminopimelate epimerase
LANQFDDILSLAVFCPSISTACVTLFSYYMMNKRSLSLHVLKSSPSGNITSLVFSPVERSLHADVSQAIMRLQPDVEQVGFAEPASSPDALGRLQMMGGEFCGNATSAFFYTLASRLHVTSGQVEVSGKSAPLQVSVAANSVTLSLQETLTLFPSPSASAAALVEMEGISHLLCDCPAPTDKAASARQLMQEHDLLERAAAGVIFLEQHSNGASITPVVWVKATGSLVEESACASGSMAVALWLSAQEPTRPQPVEIRQPSGELISLQTKWLTPHQAVLQMQSQVHPLEDTDLTLEI